MVALLGFLPVDDSILDVRSAVVGTRAGTAHSALEVYIVMVREDAGGQAAAERIFEVPTACSRGEGSTDTRTRRNSSHGSSS